MASLATGFVSKKLKGNIQTRAKAYEPQDPYYYVVVVDGKEKRKKREPPPGLTKQQAKLLRKIQRRAHYLDKGFQVGPFRFGWTFFIGLIPGAGDAADAALNWFLVVKPAKNGFDLPKWLVSQMVLNNVISAGVGLVPFAGDIMLAVWRANSRNAKLLEEYLRVVGEAQIAQGLPNLTKGDNHHVPPSAKKGTGSAPSDANAVHPGQSAARVDAQEVLRASSGQLDTSTATQASAAEVEQARTSRWSLRGRGSGSTKAAPAAAAGP
ncbi:hypothetical protein OC834_005082 [Tilletia horrida]|uniref:Uncharacterized protein n=1 Tax=Tilletia horrida TaxID=155126 RepID=A0AAN6GIV4_9BASI|nr:hypothetical protein OC835_007455 [Tilletia horrida]KAK0525672.1 hypothetical protein OC834_005082 [Tilletia horrida]KAK0541254.1 hypothetical protein OC842_000087 [Tilletia horrida]KAK0557648.1 hypothetical protein OC844_005532 [Tilletia horrida]